MSLRTRLSKLETRRPAPLSVSWVVLRDDGSAFLRLADGTTQEADPDHLPRVKAYGEKADPDAAWNDGGLEHEHKKQD